MGGRSRAARRSRVSPVALYTVLSVFMVAAIFYQLGQSQQPWVAYLAGVSVATLVMYAYDKFAAVRAWLRVPELVLHGLALAGGSPAAFVAQRVWHHKTIKASFQRVFWGIVVVQAFGIGALLYFRGL